MQATLLTIAIAVILAVVAALVGPFFIDWGTYRSAFEREASRATGLEVRVGGEIDLRVLPAPRLQLQNVALGGGADPLRTRSLTIEFELAPLLRGEWRASEMRLIGPELKLAVDEQGRFSGPNAGVSLDPESVSIDRLGIEDGRLVLNDAASQRVVALEKLWFNGELRSLIGPLRGEGAFTLGGEVYPYRLTSGRLSESGAVRLRLNVDPLNLPFNIETDGTLEIADKAQFEGTLNLARPVGIAQQAAGSLVTQPWRFGSKLKITPASALMQDAEFSYGSEPNAVKLSGTAEMKFGARPRFDGVLSARQIDLDRLAGELESKTRAPPIVTIRRLVALTGQAFKPAFPVQMGIGIDQATLGGADIMNVRGDVSTAPDGWTLERFEFRAPGGTQATLSGQLATTSSGLRFAGPAEIAANDPRALTAWLEGRSEAPSTAPPRPLRLRGDVTLGSEKVAVERLNASFDRGSISGSFAYTFATRDKGARVETSLNAPELDLDAVHALGRALLAGSAVEQPSEALLAVEIGRATFAGFDAGKSSARLQYGRDGIRIERLSIENLGGANIAASGQVALTPIPRGNLTFDLNARELAGVIALIARYSPELADRLRGVATSLAPAKLRANLRMDDAPGNRANVLLDGTFGALRLNVEGQAGVSLATFGAMPSDPTNVRLRGKLDSDNAQVLATLFGYERYVALRKEPASLTVNATGAGLGQLQVESRLTGGGLDATANGNVGVGPAAPPQGSVKLTVSRADFAPLRGGTPLPANFQAALGFSPDRLSFEQLSGNVAGSNIRGKLALGRGETRTVSGEIETDTLDAGLLLAGAIGMPPGMTLWKWPAEPFSDGLPGNLAGSLDLRAMRATLAPNLTARELRTTLRVDRDELALEDFSASVAGGRLTGRLTFKETAQGLATQAQLVLANADVTTFLPDAARPPITGRLGLDVYIEGTGRSPQALLGSLQGAGSVTLGNAEFAALDPRAFATVTRAVDQGQPIEAPRIQSFTTSALTSGRLSVRELKGDLTISVGQVRLANLRAKGEGADVTIGGTLDLTNGTIDSRIVLTGVDQVSGARPDVFLSLRGPLTSAERNIDASALTSWLTLRAVERQSKALEAIERQPAPAAAPPIVAPPPQPAPPPPAPRSEAPPAAAPRSELQAPPAARGEAPARPPRPAAPALPPPIDITPGSITRTPPPPAVLR